MVALAEKYAKRTFTCATRECACASASFSSVIRLRSALAYADIPSWIANQLRLIMILREDYLVTVAPLLRVKVKFRVKFPVCRRRRISHTANLTVNMTSTRTSRAALRRRVRSRSAGDVACRELVTSTIHTHRLTSSCHLLSSVDADRSQPLLHGPNLVKNLISFSAM